MLRMQKSYNLQDFLRSNLASRNYGLQVSKNYRAIQWYGAYSDTQRTIVYFVARQIDDGINVLVNYDLDIDLIKYENGQYLYDNTKLFDGYLPNGTYYFEFNDGFETYRSQIFSVSDRAEPLICSSVLSCSSSVLINALTISNPNPIVLKQFSTEEYVQFNI